MGKRFPAFVGALIVAITCGVVTTQPSRADWQRDMICQGGCGGGCPCNRTVERADPPERPDPEDLAAELRNKQYDQMTEAENAAFGSEDFARALQLALQRQQLRDGPNVRGRIALYRGLLADQGRDYQAAIRYFENAVEENSEYGSWVDDYKKRVADYQAAERQAAERRAAVEQKIRNVIDAVNDPGPVAASSLEMMGAVVSPPAEDANHGRTDIQTARTLLSADAVRERTRQPNRQVQEIMRSLKIKEPPSPVKNVANLEQGDVILVAPPPSPGIFRKGFLDAAKSAGINMLDRWGSDNWSSTASHAAIFLGERNGKRWYLDNTSEHGPVVKEESQFFKEYGGRSMDVATLVGQPLSKHEGEELWKGAHELRKTTSYGIEMLAYNGSDAMVCSEAARWLLVRAGRRLPETQSPSKEILGAKVNKKDFVSFSPADFYEDQQYFLLHQLSTEKIDKKP